jgi:peptidoglycan/LPS O-acetylase OafA/YrhL
MAFVVFIIRFSDSFEARLTRKESRKKWIVKLSALSFGVYIFHTGILELLKKWLGTLDFFLISFLVIAISFGLIALFDRFIKPKWIRTVLGI